MKNNNLPLNDSVQYHFYSPCNLDTRGIVSSKAKFHEVIAKYIDMGGDGVYVVDFDDSIRFIGCIGRMEINKAICEMNETQRLTAADMANKNCYTAALESLDKDIAMIDKFRYFPVVDEKNCFQFYISDKALWSIWDKGQAFETDYWRDYLRNRYPVEGIPKISVDRLHINDESIKNTILSRLNGGTVIEVGAGPFTGYLWSASDAARRIIIEPLGEVYKGLRDEFGVLIPGVDEIDVYPVGGDIFIPELENIADVIFCQNTLDHTPYWPFILGNIARYQKKGGYFYLATDIDHHEANMAGHYNISYNPDKLYQLLVSLGYDIIYKLCYTRTIGNTFVVVVGLKC